MPNFKPVIRKDYTSKNGKARIYIQVPFKSDTRLIKTEHYIEPRYMQDNGRVKDTYPNASALNIALGRKVIQYEEIYLRNEVRTMSQLMNLLKDNQDSKVDFFKYVKDMVTQLDKEERHSTSGVYNAIMVSLKKHTHKETLAFSDIDSNFLEKYKDSMLLKGKSINTIIEYISKINVIINSAVSRNVVDIRSLSPRKITLKGNKPPVRLLDLADIRKLLYNPYPKLIQKAVDCFFLSFFLTGINIIDICYAKEDDVYKGRLLYERLKTKGSVSVNIPDVAWAIINKYKGVKHLLSFIDKNDSHVAFKGFSNKINERLKLAAQIAGIDIHLTHNYARRSWATIASSNELKIPLEVIDKAQGRRSGEINNRYVKYDIDRIDEANEKVIKLLYSF